jgi:beta-fructofuranosidase
MDRRLWFRTITALAGGAMGLPRLAAYAQPELPFPNDPHRPRYHFLPPRNWMNDPNGLIHHNGLYHVFYQHNPGAAVWGNMHWGHAVSKDLLQWEHRPMALAPGPEPYDKDGVFSGCMVVDGETPTILYTGTQPEVQAIATAADAGLDRWTKFAGNPVIAAPPAGLEATGFRDPFVWKEGDDWLMAVGSGKKGVGGMVLLYRSPDLRRWDYLHPLVQSDDLALGSMWECPNFFPLGNKHVLLFSPIPLKKALYAVGTYEDRVFRIEQTGSLDDGGHFYAPQVFLDAAGRRVMFGWAWEGRTEAAQVQAGWAGAFTLPRVLSLDDAGRVRTDPHPYCQRLYRFRRGVRSSPVGDALNQEITKAGISGNAGRLDVSFEVTQATSVELALLASPDGSEQTRLVWKKDPGLLTITRSRASLSDSQDRSSFQTPLRLAKNERLQLTVFLDRSLVEVYTEGAPCMTTRVYPESAASVGFRISGEGKRLMLREMVWRPIAHQTS